MEIKPITLETQIKFLRDNAVANELMIIPKKGYFWGAFINEELVGSIGYMKYGKYYKIDCHYVKKSNRKKGIGKILFDFMYNQLKRYNVMAYATEDSINFYLKEGFVIDKRYKRTYLVKREAL